MKPAPLWPRPGGYRGAVRAIVLAASLAGLAEPAEAEPVRGTTVPGTPQPPVMMSLATGSRVAVWTVPAVTAPARATPILFLHGGPGLYVEDRRIAEGGVFRQRGFTTIYFDQAGGGRSDRLPVTDYSLQRAISDLEALRLALGSEQLILWGNSYGADLATLYAQRFPQRVAALILTSPGLFPGLDAKRDYSMTARDKVVYSPAIRDAVSRIDRSPAAAEKQISQAEAGKLFDELVGEELIEGVVCKNTAVRPPPLPGGGNLYAQRAIFRDLKKMRPPEKSNVSVPAIVIRGGCDFIPAASAERYSAFFRARLVAIPDTGHGLLERHDLVDAALAAFATNELASIR